MSERLARAFARCRERRESALVTYVMAGDPSLRASEQMALACAEGGADVLELGMPFSDPIADGPTLQLAAQRALASGTTAQDCIELAARVRSRQPELPIALMGYLNPIAAFGEQRFVDACAQARVDALIVPDLPPEEAGPLADKASAAGLALVFLVAPTTPPERLDLICARASGFLYFVSVTGVTGARQALPEDLKERLDKVRQKSTVPVVVGFGISSPEQAKSLSESADGIVVGSAIVSRIAEPGPLATRMRKVTAFVRGLKRATLANERSRP